MTHQIIAEPSTGLGNRLRCIGSLMRIARRIGAEFALSWPVTVHFPAPFGDLYDEPLDLRHGAPSDPAEETSGRGRDKQSFYLERGCQVTVITSDHLQYPTIHARAAYLYLLETRPGIPEPRANAMREAGTILAGLRLNPYVAERLDEASREFEIGSRVGVHVRRGDVPANRCVELQRFFETIADKHAADPLFVASDDQHVLRAFEKQFGDRVAVFEARSRLRAERTAGPDALIEMLLLSRTRRIVTGPSSFTEVAAMIGNIRRDVLRPA